MVLRMASAIFELIKSRSRSEVWKDFLADTTLQKANRITAEELELLGNFSPFGALTGKRDLLFILETIRWARDRKPNP